MVTDQQVRRLRQKIMDGKKQEAAAAAAGMSVRTARTWQRGPLPSEKKRDRHWRENLSSQRTFFILASSAGIFGRKT